MKKYIVFSLCLIMMLLCFVPASASSSSMLAVGNVEVGIGDKVIVPVTLENNPGFVSMSLSVTYDTSALTLISCEYTNVISGSVHSANYVSPYILTWENDILTSNITETGTIVYLTFLVNENATEQDYSVIVRIPTDGILDADGNSVSADSAMGTITVAQRHECTFGEWEEYSARKHVRYCTECDEREFEYHSWDDGIVIQEPSCDEDGIMRYTCEVCGATDDDTIASVEHSYEAMVTAPTCTEEGYTTYTCTECGDSYEDNYVDVVDHNYHDGYCIYCGTVDEGTGTKYDRDVAISEVAVSYWETTGKWSFTVFVENVGNQALTGISIEVRKESSDGERVHGTRFIDAVEPNGGFGQSYSSLTDNLIEPETFYIWTGINYESDDNMSNNYLIVVITPQDDGETCWMHGTLDGWTTNGADGHIIDCEDCGKTFTSLHWYDDSNTCVICGYERENVHAHSYETTVTAPTCTEEGYTTYTCTDCGDSYVDDYVVALGHRESILPGKSATCTENGLTAGKKCTVCNEMLVAQEVIAALGHDYESVITVPTCTEKGYTTHTCTRCGDSYVDNYTDPLDPETAVHVEIGSISGKAGDTVEVILTLKNAPELKALGIKNLVYDRDALTLISGEWLLDGALLMNWENDKEVGAVAYQQNKDLNGEIFKLTFRINDNVEAGDYAISCTVTAKEKSTAVETVVPVAVMAGVISVKDYVVGDLDGNDMVDTDDAIYLLYYTLFGDDGYAVDQNCDFNGDGMVDTDDAIYLLYHTLFGEGDYPLN